MKKQRFNLFGAAAITAVLTMNANAQLTWDPENATDPWDTITDAWNDGSAPPYSVWDNTGMTEAIFEDEGANYTVSVETGSVVNVGDLTYQGTNVLTFASVFGDSMLTLVADSTWDTGGGRIDFASDQSGALNLGDVGLNLAGFTLTVNGGGGFDTGERGNGVNWTAGDLVFTAGTVVRGAGYNIGQLNSVTLATGSTFVMERNADQDINNNWVLNGDSTFTNRFGGRTIWANGEISGTGRLTVQGLNSNASGSVGFLRLNNAANSWSGGLTVNGGINYTIAEIAGADDRLGAVPASLDVDNIILLDGGALKMNNMNLNANRGITLAGTGGVIINRNNPNTINGPITGPGSLSIGNASDASANTTILASNANDYAGDTNVVRGTLQLGADDAIPSGSIVAIGGGSANSNFDLNGFNTTIGGLTIAGANTREIKNNGATASTLTFDVASGESHSYGANVNGTGVLNIVKNGLGSQIFDRNGGYTSGFGDVTVNEGTLELGNDNGTTPVSGAISVTGGLLAIGETLVGVTSVTGTGGTIRIGNDSYLGDVPAAPVADYITLDGGTLNAQMSGGTGGSFEINSNRGITLGAGGGTISTTTPSGAWTVSYNGVITGPGGLTKTAGQGLELGGANTYTGDTIITGGTLRLLGSLTSDVIVQSGVIIPGDFLNGTGTGSMNALTFDAGGKMTCFINSDLVDANKAVVSGDVTIDAASTLTVADRGSSILSVGTKLTLIDYNGGTLVGEFAGLPDGTTFTVGANQFTIDYNDNLVANTVTLTAAGSADVYLTWANSFAGFTDTALSVDFDNGSLPNGIEYVVGGDPTLGSDDSSLAPTVASTGSGITFTYRRTDLANDDPNTTISAEYGTDLNSWTTAVDGVDGVTISVTDEIEPGVDEVVVTLPDTLAPSGKLFTRLNVEQP